MSVFTVAAVLSILVSLAPAHAVQQQPRLIFSARALGDIAADAQYERYAREAIAAALGKSFCLGDKGAAAADTDRQEICTGDRAKGVVVFTYSAHLIPLAGPSGTRSVTDTIQLSSCYGTYSPLVGIGAGQSDTGAELLTSREFDVMVRRIKDNALKAAVTDFIKQIASHQEEIRNLSSFGFTLNNTERSPLVTLANTSSSAATVSRIDPRGTAARAGLKQGGEILELNGIELGYGSGTNLYDAVVAANMSGHWHVKYRSNGSSVVEIDFPAESVLWYVAHPADEVMD